MTALTDFTPDQLVRALKLVESYPPHVRRPRGSYDISSSDGLRLYRTTADVCSCPAGENGRLCYHRAIAVAMDELDQRHRSTERPHSCLPKPVTG